MKVLLRLREVPDVLVAQLARAQCCTPDTVGEELHKFMSLKAVAFDSDGHAQVDLVIEETFFLDTDLGKTSDRREEPVTREMVGKLFYLLDIFPPRDNRANIDAFRSSIMEVISWIDRAIREGCPPPTLLLIRNNLFVRVAKFLAELEGEVTTSETS